MNPINKYLVNKHVSLKDMCPIQIWDGKKINTSRPKHENLFKTGDCVKISWTDAGTVKKCLAIINKDADHNEVKPEIECAFIVLNSAGKVMANDTFGLYNTNTITPVSADEFKLLSTLYNYYIKTGLQNKKSRKIGNFANGEFIPKEK